MNKLGNNIVHEDLTILDFTNIKNNGGSPNFNYYKYRGSFTSPPCEEDVIWIIKAEPVPLGPTVITFINEVLSVPED